MTVELNARPLMRSGNQSSSQVGMQICDRGLAAPSPLRSCLRYPSMTHCAKNISCVGGVVTPADQSDDPAKDHMFSMISMNLPDMDLTAYNASRQ
jgi:hypothetical protein